jgi:hypothetical protein
MASEIKFRSRSKIVRSIANTVNGSLGGRTPIKAKSKYRKFLSRDASYKNGLVEYAIDNDMIEYQRNVFKNRQDR